MNFKAMRHIIGIDVGTSGVKVVLLDEKQNIISTETISLKTTRERQGWSEQHPDLWWQAVMDALEALRTNQSKQLAQVGWIGVTGQMHGLVILDDLCVPLCPAILWNDGRAAKEARELHQKKPELADKNGVLPMAGLTAPKVLWLQKNNRDLFEKIRWVVSPKDYINFKLTGRLVTDFSDAAGTWFLDQAERRWSREAVELVGLDLGQFPELVESTDIIGTVVPEIIDKFGLQKEVEVVGGGGDTPVGAVGLGCTNPGTAEISLGTSAHVFAPTATYVPDTELLVHSFCHALPNIWFQMAAMLNGASVFKWFSTMLEEDVAVLEQLVDAKYKGPGDLLFLPYLVGERTPLNNPDARGVFFGLNPEHTKVDMAQAIFEGVAYSLADGVRCLLDSGTTFNQIALAGGGAKSRVWAQIIASTLNLPVVCYKGGNVGPALGAARLAMLAMGMERQQVCHPPDVEETVYPDEGHVGQYKKGLVRFQKLYSCLESEF